MQFTAEWVLIISFEFLTGHEWGSAPESPCGVCAEERSEEGGSEAARDGEDDDEGLSQERLEGETNQLPADMKERNEKKNYAGSENHSPH